jgi:hypothetical protein
MLVPRVWGGHSRRVAIRDAFAIPFIARPLSTHTAAIMTRKLSAKMADTNARISQAVSAIQNGKFKTPYAAAKFFKVDRNTLTRRINGRRDHTQGHEQAQLLSSAEEDTLRLWIRRLTIGGYPASHQLIKEMVLEILTRRVTKINDDGMELVSLPTIGQDWVKRFLKRYPTLKTRRSQVIDLARWRDTSPEAINEWFDAFEDTMQTHHFSASDIYNMDETGFAIETSQSNRVVIDTTLRTRYKVEPGRQEWVTTIECICGDGTVLSPLIIFKAAQISNNWISASTPHDWRFSASSKGWTSNVYRLE